MTSSILLVGLISGMIAAGCLVAALFFARYFRRTHDALFVYFAVAFVLLAVEKLAVLVVPDWYPEPPWLFIVRLAAFVAIGAGIWEKNRA
jgi:phosphoglycerol transferase MdoB-like AlkP superfamily enzyme